MQVAIGILFGALITLLITIGVESFRRPRLTLAIETPPHDAPSPDGKQMRRHLRLKLRNEPLPSGMHWMQRSAALQCRGEITFHHLDGQDVFGRAMAARWVSSPEPVASQVLNLKGELQYQIRDFARTATESRVDVYPGEDELLDVAVRFDGEPEC